MRIPNTPLNNVHGCALNALRPVDRLCERERIRFFGDCRAEAVGAKLKPNIGKMHLAQSLSLTLSTTWQNPETKLDLVHLENQSQPTLPGSAG